MENRLRIRFAQCRSSLRSQLPQKALVRLAVNRHKRDLILQKNLKNGHRDLLFEAVSPCTVRSRDSETRQGPHVESMRQIAL